MWVSVGALCFGVVSQRATKGTMCTGSQIRRGGVIRHHRRLDHHHTHRTGVHVVNTTLSLSDAIDQLLAEDKIASLPAWEGAPLGFTSRYYSAADLDAAAERRALVDATKPWHDRTPARMKSRLLRRPCPVRHPHHRDLHGRHPMPVGLPPAAGRTTPPARLRTHPLRMHRRAPPPHRRRHLRAALDPRRRKRRRRSMERPRLPRLARPSHPPRQTPRTDGQPQDDTQTRGMVRSHSHAGRDGAGRRAARPAVEVAHSRL